MGECAAGGTPNRTGRGKGDHPLPGALGTGKLQGTVDEPVAHQGRQNRDVPDAFGRDFKRVLAEDDHIGELAGLKAADQMEWVRRMNSIRSRAEETVLIELVYE